MLFRSTLLYFVKTGEDANTIEPNKPWGERPVANASVVNKYYNKKAYTDPTLRATYTKSGHWYNIRLIRYADVVLMAAEAANETGKTGEAMEYLEMVRARARGSNAAVLPKVTTTDPAEMRKAIRHERRVELGMEFDRFYDLVRWVRLPYWHSRQGAWAKAREQGERNVQVAAGGVNSAHQPPWEPLSRWAPSLSVGDATMRTSPSLPRATG